MQAEGYLAEYHKCKISVRRKLKIAAEFDDSTKRLLGTLTFDNIAPFEYIENIPLVVALVKKLNIRVPVSR